MKQFIKNILKKEQITIYDKLNLTTTTNGLQVLWLGLAYKVCGGNKHVSELSNPTLGKWCDEKPMKTH